MFFGNSQAHTYLYNPSTEIAPKAFVAAGVHSGLAVMLKGESLQDALINGVAQGIGSTIGMWGAQEIGAAFGGQVSLVRYFLHGLVGGISQGIITQSKEGAISGAMGAALGEAVMDLVSPSTTALHPEVEARVQGLMQRHQGADEQQVREAVTRELLETPKFISQLVAMVSTLAAGHQPQAASEAARVAIENNHIKSRVADVLLAGVTTSAAPGETEEMSSPAKRRGSPEPVKDTPLEQGLDGLEHLHPVTEALFEGGRVASAALGSGIQMNLDRAKEARQALVQDLSMAAVARYVNAEVAALPSALCAVGGMVVDVAASGVRKVLRASGVPQGVAQDIVKGGEILLGVGTTVGMGRSAGRAAVTASAPSATEALIPPRLAPAATPSLWAEGGYNIRRGRDGRIKSVEHFQNHHILSDKNPLTQDHPLWELAGVSPQHPANRILLPTREGAATTTTQRSIHQGRHDLEVIRTLRREMDDVVTDGERLGYAQQQYREGLLHIMSQERAALLNGERKLNTHAQPHAES